MDAVDGWDKMEECMFFLWQGKRKQKEKNKLNLIKKKKRKHKTKLRENVSERKYNFLQN